jgi:chemotaxis protein methyltransferase CheR
VATDIDPQLIDRARRGCFRASSLREVPAELLALAFERSEQGYVARAALREFVEFRCQDLREEMPEGYFDLILCRNLAFTYFGAELQRELLARLCGRLQPGGALVVGLHESLPAEQGALAPWPGTRAVYERAADPPRPGRR